jgi:3-oxoacyl-[acyl-carrier protein] reductase
MGKNILIIGASGDIGIAIAEQLMMDDYQLILHYHKNKQPINQLKNRLDSELILMEIQADLSSEIEVNKFLERMIYPIDAIVFASGTAHYGLFQDLSVDELNNMLALHVTAPLTITKKLLVPMIQKQTGQIIFITSIWGSVGASHEVIYSTVKGAQNSFVKSLAKEVGPSGISVNGVSPGFIDTKMNHHLLEAEKQAVISDIPMNRSGTPNDIAHTVRFLLDEKSSYIQGEIIQVTGGW